MLWTSQGSVFEPLLWNLFFDPLDTGSNLEKSSKSYIKHELEFCYIRIQKSSVEGSLHEHVNSFRSGVYDFLSDTKDG